jgi:hypothetical protein
VKADGRGVLEGRASSSGAAAPPAAKGTVTGRGTAPALFWVMFWFAQGLL